MFANTLRLVGECGLTHLHVFPFSTRGGTPAALKPPIEAGAISARAKRLRAAGDAARARHLAAQVGKRLSLLTEQGGTGRTADFKRVRIRDVAAGRLIAAEIIGQDGEMLIGEQAA